MTGKNQERISFMWRPPKKIFFFPGHSTHRGTPKTPETGFLDYLYFTKGVEGKLRTKEQYEQGRTKPRNRFMFYPGTVPF